MSLIFDDDPHSPPLSPSPSAAPLATCALARALDDPAQWTAFLGALPDALSAEVTCEHVGAVCVRLCERVGEEAVAEAFLRGGAKWLTAGLMRHVVLHDLVVHGAPYGSTRTVWAALLDASYVPSEILARECVAALVAVVEQGRVGSADAVQWLEHIALLDGAGANAAFEELAGRAAHAMTRGLLALALRKMFVALGRAGPLDLVAAFHRGFLHVVARAGVDDDDVVHAAVVLATAVVGARCGALLLPSLQKLAHTHRSEAVRVLAVQSLTSLLALPGVTTHVCTSANCDSAAAVRLAAVDSLSPDGPGSVLTAEVADTLAQRLCDRNQGVRKRAAAVLLLWGAPRVVRALAVPALVPLLHLAAACPTGDVALLLVQLLHGPEAVVWLRRLHILESERWRAFVAANDTTWLRRLVFVTAHALADDQDSASPGEAVALDDSE